CIVVRQGRHPVVERMLDGFVPNDLYLDREAHQLLVLTGPNMAGKSTYLRQVPSWPCWLRWAALYRQQRRLLAWWIASSRGSGRLTTSLLDAVPSWWR